MRIRTTLTPKSLSPFPLNRAQNPLSRTQEGFAQPVFGGGKGERWRWALPVAALMTLPVAGWLFYPKRSPEPPIVPVSQSDASQIQFNPGKTLTWKEFDDLGRDYLIAQSQLKGGIETQKRLVRAMEPELYPALAKLFEKGPDGKFTFDEVLVAEFNPTGWAHPGPDGGRGLRVVFRKEVEGHRIRAIMFLDVNLRTGRLELVNDSLLPAPEQEGYTPDAFRCLFEMETPDNPDEGLIGSSFSVKRDLLTGRILDVEPGIYHDEQGRVRVTQNGQKLYDGLTAATCDVCHDRRPGLAGRFTPFEELQRFFHKDSPKYIQHFDADMTRRGIDPEVREQLKRVLQSPKDHLEQLIPEGLLEVIQRKAEQYKP